MTTEAPYSRHGAELLRRLVRQLSIVASGSLALVLLTGCETTPQAILLPSPMPHWEYWNENEKGESKQLFDSARWTPRLDHDRKPASSEPQSSDTIAIVPGTVLTVSAWAPLAIRAHECAPIDTGPSQFRVVTTRVRYLPRDLPVVPHELQWISLTFLRTAIGRPIELDRIERFLDEHRTSNQQERSGDQEEIAFFLSHNRVMIDFWNALLDPAVGGLSLVRRTNSTEGCAAQESEPSAKDCRTYLAATQLAASVFKSLRHVLNVACEEGSRAECDQLGALIKKLQVTEKTPSLILEAKAFLGHPSEEPGPAALSGRRTDGKAGRLLEAQTATTRALGWPTEWDSKECSGSTGSTRAVGADVAVRASVPLAPDVREQPEWDWSVAEWQASGVLGRLEAVITRFEGRCKEGNQRKRVEILWPGDSRVASERGGKGSYLQAICSEDTKERNWRVPYLAFRQASAEDWNREWSDGSKWFSGRRQVAGDFNSLKAEADRAFDWEYRGMPSQNVRSCIRAFGLRNVGRIDVRWPGSTDNCGVTHRAQFEGAREEQAVLRPVVDGKQRWVPKSAGRPCGTSMDLGK